MKLTFVLPVSAFAVAVLLAACGPQPQAPASPETPVSLAASATDTAPTPTVAAQADAATAAAAPAAEANAGQVTFNRNCSICHATGTAGAPKPGDKADWEPRLAQGVDVLYKHAIEGFTGSKGVMPARGGAGNLSDDEIKATVDYMLSVGG
jgi:cytochrome c5